MVTYPASARVSGLNSAQAQRRARTHAVPSDPCCRVYPPSSAHRRLAPGRPGTTASGHVSCARPRSGPIRTSTTADHARDGQWTTLQSSGSSSALTWSPQAHGDPHAAASVATPRILPKRMPDETSTARARWPGATLQGDGPGRDECRELGGKIDSPGRSSRSANRSPGPRRRAGRRGLRCLYAQACRPPASGQSSESARWQLAQRSSGIALSSRLGSAG